MLMKIW